MFRAYQFSSAQDIDQQWIDQVSALFAGKAITITIQETENETQFLLRNEANRQMLLESVMQDHQGQTIDHHLEEL